MRRVFGRGGNLPLFFLAAAFACLACDVDWDHWNATVHAPSSRAADAVTASFVGSAACADCHKSEYEAWRQTHHAAAMQRATASSVLGRFDGSAFEKDGAATAFSKKGDTYFVLTPGPDGALAEFEIKYAFGVAPLQQYLVALPGGRLQALGVAWDSRPAAQGGQRWFDLYPKQKFGPGDPLHWTGVDQNWNYQCAWCHTTDFKKNYNIETKSFRSDWSEIGVGCEACHGPASNHLAWARGDEAQRKNPPPGHGFALLFDERRGVTWSMDEAGRPKRSAPRHGEKEILQCAGCHARRGQFSDDPKSVATFYDAFRPAVLETPLYFEDGQQHEEVYNFASFLQSRMYAAGVTCSDCHDPHSSKIRAPGNDVCARCHARERYDQPAHHHHAQGSAGADCANCHMPTTTYMGVHQRHDHSLRLPRPDQSVSLGVPNACNKCHQERAPAWAQEALESWGAVAPRGFQNFVEAFDLADRGAPGAQAALTKVIEGANQSSLARASAIARLSRAPSQEGLKAATRAIAIDDPLIRMAAISVIAQADPQMRRQFLAPLLADKSRLIRIDAARALAGEAEQQLNATEHAQFVIALQDYIDAQLFNAERAESHANLGALNQARGKTAEARAAYGKAIELDSRFYPASIALAELLRSAGDESGAESVLRKSLTATPDAGAAHHALGLSLIRQGRPAEALAELADAARLAPQDARFAFVYAVALHDLGDREKARSTLEAALKRTPYDRDILLGLAGYEAESGELASAKTHVDLVLQLAPNDQDARDLAESLGRSAQ